MGLKIKSLKIIKTIIRYLLISALFLFLQNVNPYNCVCAKNRTCILAIINKDNRMLLLNAEVADNYESRQTGLMHRDSLDENSGMLFVFSSETRLNFWMKNTYIPLTIAYINKKGVIKEIIDMKPLNISRTYPSSVPAMYALEVNSGWFKKNSIVPGCRIDLNGCIGKQD